jgi:uncharacterized protein YjiS (DUF1127 family)
MNTNAATWGAGRPQQNAIVAIITHIGDAISRARSRRQTTAALAELDDRALLDIGVNPRDVRRSTRAAVDWVVQSHSGTARLIFIGR